MLLSRPTLCLLFLSSADRFQKYNQSVKHFGSEFILFANEELNVIFYSTDLLEPITYEMSQRTEYPTNYT